ncbi:hypothetical protein ACO22_01973 [Paracoccidioides brasiliensis]|uniref:Uncharacterized protein n=1 Tax=Paracoccidioides brasiliensis TaxID=121759 RepID=A0A1D2JJZ6_PARBR|nr:hypothetical protein ACO22_01973 [Paracoccidioides brasiliensis]
MASKCNPQDPGVVDSNIQRNRALLSHEDPSDMAEVAIVRVFAGKGSSIGFPLIHLDRA